MWTRLKGREGSEQVLWKADDQSTVRDPVHDFSVSVCCITDTVQVHLASPLPVFGSQELREEGNGDS